MPYREILDDGEVWIVFSTQPRSGANVRPQYAEGWLSFHRGTERRRLAPIPEGWDDAAEEQMLVWLLDADPVARAADDEEGTIDPAAERRAVARDAPEEPAVAAVPEPVDADSPAAPDSPSGPAARVQKSIERIRAMLSDIRPRDG